MELTDFLRARFNEDEAVAQESTPSPWISWVEGRDGFGGDSGLFLGGDGTRYDVYGWARPEDQDHVARHEPARVLAEVEAKRRIVGIAEDHPFDRTYSPELLGILALPYADHPDYRDEWTP